MRSNVANEMFWDADSIRLSEAAEIPSLRANSRCVAAGEEAYTAEATGAFK